jgi:uncharacterized protein YjdB
MKLRFSRFMLSFAFLAGFILLTTVLWETSAYAADESASDLTELQTKLDAAMHSRPDTYSITYSGGALSKKDLAGIMNAIYNTDDYLLYSTKTYRYSMISDKKTSTVTFSFTYWETLAQSNDVTAKVNELLSSIITADMNDFQKEKAIHDWIESNLAYDTTLAQHSAYAGLFDGKKTVCQGYALLAYRMLSEAGLPNKIVEGNAGGQLHTWNLVQLEGNWYHLDTTWDDPVPDEAGRIMYGYFNLTDNQIKTNHTWKKKYPEATTVFADTLSGKESSDPANAAFYQNLEQLIGLDYLKDELTASNQAQLAAKIKEAIAANQTSFTVRYTMKKTIAKDLKAAVSEFGNISKYSYSMPDFSRSALATDVLLTVNLTYSDPVAAASLSINPDSAYVFIGKPVALIPTVQPANASTKSVTWVSSDSSIAAVSATGIITGKAAGTATITATTIDGGLTASAEITVVQPVTRVTLNKTSLNLKVGDPDFTLISTLAPVNAADKTISWASSNIAVVTVDSDGIVHAVAAGKATITAKSSNGKAAAAAVIVKP